MEHSWERLHAFVPLTREEVDARLGEAGLPRADSFALLTHGRANTNYRVLLGDGTAVALRLHTRDPKAARREAAIAERVADLVPAPRVLYAAPDGGFSVQEWREGTPMLDALARGEVLDGESFGRALAALATIRFPEAGFLGPDFQIETPLGEPVAGYLAYIRDLLAQPLVAEHLGTERQARIAARLDHYAFLLEPFRGRATLVHSDFKPSNLLVKDGRLAAVLDWEFTHAGAALLDFSILLRDSRLRTEAFASALERGYRSAGGFLPGRWQEAARLLDLINLLDFLNRPAEQGTLVRDCVALIDEPLLGG